MNEQLLGDIKYALENIQKQSEWFHDRSTAGALL